MTREKMVSKVLEVKEIKREQIEAEVRKAREKLSAEQQKLQDLEQAYKANSVELTDRQVAGTLPVREMDVYYAYLKHVCRQIQLQKDIITIRQREVDEREKGMFEAYQEQRLVEILHDKIVCQEAKLAGQAEQKDRDAEFIMRKTER
jgi:flagellar export protein FliJ